MRAAKAAMLARRGFFMTIDPSNTVLAFDVYGTLIDPFHMEEHLRPAFGERAREASELWRSKQLEYSFRRALMKKYVDFNHVHRAGAAIRVRTTWRRTFGGSSADLMDRYLKLPAYADVPAALESLAARGFQIVACSNGTESAVRGLLDHAGVLRRFQRDCERGSDPHIQAGPGGVRISGGGNARGEGKYLADFEQSV